MREYETHHLIVLGRGTHRPVGIISTLDIAEVLAELSQLEMPTTGVMSAGIFSEETIT
jgi:CBS domain-containing protein